MAQFNVSVLHQTTRDDAIEKLRGFSEKIRDEFAGQVSDLAETWDDDGNLQFAFKAMGMAVDGTVKTDSDKVDVSGNLPFTALPFRGLIEQTIADKIGEALNG